MSDDLRWGLAQFMRWGAGGGVVGLGLLLVSWGLLLVVLGLLLAMELKAHLGR